MKLTKAAIDRAEYQNLHLAALVKQRDRGELSEAEYEEAREKLLSPYAKMGKDGKPKYRRYVLWDSEVKGLGLRITPSGVKTFVLSYRHNGTKRLMKLGRYGVLTLDQARGRAKTQLVLSIDGTDPLKERQDRKREASEAKTVADLCKKYIKKHAKPNKKSWRDDQWRVNKYIRPNLGHLKLEDVTRERVDLLFCEIGSVHPYEANRVLVLLSGMFNLASDWGYLPQGSPNPAKKKRDRYPEKERDRPVKTEELPRLLEAIEGEKSPYLRALFKLLLLTGLRKSEWLKAKREDLDFGRATLRLADTKAGKPRHVPLSSAALEIVRGLPPMVGNPYLFPSSVKPGQPIYDTRKAWDRIRKAAKCLDLRTHDLRHSVATWLAEEGTAAQTIQKALGHQNIDQTMGYVHLGDAAPRAALEALGERIVGEGSK